MKEETEVKAETTSDDGGDGGGAADAGTAVQHLAQPSVSCPYQVGEKVIATHEHFFYEAKVILFFSIFIPFFQLFFSFYFWIIFFLYFLSLFLKICFCTPYC